MDDEIMKAENEWKAGVKNKMHNKEKLDLDSDEIDEMTAEGENKTKKGMKEHKEQRKNKERTKKECKISST